MLSSLFQLLADPSFLMAVLVSVAVFATIFTVLPIFGSSDAKNRMKSVALERNEIRQQQRALLTDRGLAKNASLRRQENADVSKLVDRLDLRRALVDESTTDMLSVAGYRGSNPLNMFLAARFFLPFITFGLSVFLVFGLGYLGDKPTLIRVAACIFGGYVGFYLPVMLVKNAASKRQASIQRAWPDALDLTLICVESGMPVEAAFRKVADEIGVQSVPLAEELILTTAELSYLQERRQAYENLAKRTGLESVRSVSQALIQAERYGTPIAHALRVLSAESREMRMNEAEKKAAALPPKLTVPMIVFFIPVLFAVILGPAMIQVAEQGFFQ